MSNINDSFFNGYYKNIWKTIIPAELTAKEVEFMLPYFKLLTRKQSAGHDVWLRKTCHRTG